LSGAKQIRVRRRRRSPGEKTKKIGRHAGGGREGGYRYGVEKGSWGRQCLRGEGEPPTTPTGGGTPPPDMWIVKFIGKALNKFVVSRKKEGELAPPVILKLKVFISLALPTED